MGQNRVNRRNEFARFIGFFEHERDCQVVQGIAFEKRSEILVNELECPVVFVVLNFDVNHNFLLGIPAVRAVARTAGIGGELESDKKSDGGLCEVSHFIKVQCT